MFRDRTIILDEMHGDQVDRPAIERMLRDVKALERKRSAVNRRFKIRVMSCIRQVALDLFDESRCIAILLLFLTM